MSSVLLSDILKICHKYCRIMKKHFKVVGLIVKSISRILVNLYSIW